MKKKQSLRILGMLALSSLLSPTPAADITIDIVAEVALVDDRNNVLGTIHVGDIITGQYAYDSNTADSNGLPTVGDYWHSNPPYGITINAGGFVFQTDPNNVEFLVEIVNDHGNPSRDNYLLRSSNNLPFINGAQQEVQVEHISWQLDDPTTTALSSEALPTVQPDLNAWESIFGLMLEGCLTPVEFGFCGFSDGSYRIGAHVISAQLVGAPSIPVNIDVKPGSDPNCFNINGHGIVPVAILGSADFDIAEIDLASLSFGGLEVRVRGNKGPLCSVEYSNDDPYLDLVCHFEDDSNMWTVGGGEATLTGNLLDGTSIEGSDSICVVP